MMEKTESEMKAEITETLLQLRTSIYVTLMVILIMGLAGTGVIIFVMATFIMIGISDAMVVSGMTVALLGFIVTVASYRMLRE